MGCGHQFVPKKKNSLQKKMFSVQIDFFTIGTHINDLSSPKRGGQSDKEKKNCAPRC